MYRIELLREAEQALAALDPAAARRIGKRLAWLAENFEQVQHEGLVGGQDDFKFRVGDYRILYKIVHADKLLRVYRIRHRRDVYKSPEVNPLPNSANEREQLPASIHSLDCCSEF